MRGRVQGVGFRWFVVRNATNSDLRGWVRNLADGSVEVLAEGSNDTLDEFERLLRRGPRMSTVTEVVVSERDPEGTLDGFRVVG